LTDRVLLERSLGNLVNNAVQHSGATRIVMGLRISGSGCARVWVIDDGRGIEPVDADHLFEDYYRGNASVVKSGFGLGLSSVRRIATLLHGAAGLDMRWRQGAAFYLEFPAQAPAKERRS
jgi:signal transduction histidine kinase